jgi:hypothetical protein
MAEKPRTIEIGIDMGGTFTDIVAIADGGRLHYTKVPSLGEAELQRKAKIPLFKQFMGTDEFALPVYVGAMFDHHWNDHAEQIAKIRKANGMPAV